MRISDWSSDVCSSDLQVEDAGHHAQAAQSGFFLRLAQGAARQVAVAVGVAAELEPAIKLAVVGQQHALPRTVDQPGRGGEMTGQAPPFERIRIIEQLDEHGCERRLLGTTRGMFDQLPAKGVGLIRGFHASSFVRRQSGRQAYPAWHAACACHAPRAGRTLPPKSEEHTSELQSLMRISYAVFCLK